ncbi:hypothetical protein NM688_g4894 [Phlebia brevispora]|uniref:Uncharacterized protein n=1 Tax=Phlebia brevispora TaxID=194682 RepID=A0ACC1T1U1_9APHY|nr:hypothetical protein NM688_g4894 [Phlebia brevispora]
MPIPPELPIPLPPSSDYHKQSYEVPGTKRPGQTGHYRSTAFPFLTLDNPTGFTNLVEFFDSGRKHVPGDHPMLGKRPVVGKNPLKYADYYEWWTWDAVDVRRRYVGSAVHKLFEDRVIGGPLRAVGIYSGNSPGTARVLIVAGVFSRLSAAWMLVDLATHAYDLVSVPLYDTLGKDTVEFIINHTDMPLIFVTSQHIPKLLKISSKIPTLKIIVAMEPLELESKTILAAWGEQVGVKIMDLPELEEFGKANIKPVIYPNPDTIATICYTSGTTGQPKGVVLTHGNLASACYAQLHGLNFKEVPICMAFLPLAHCYGRMAVIGTIGRGGSLGFWSNDPLLLLEDIKILRPTMLPAVPRVLNRIYQAGTLAAKMPGVKGALFRHALQVKLDRLHTTGVQTHAFWDRLVFKKARSAPMSTAAIDFLKVATNADIMEENVGSATRVWPFDATASGTVGPPHPNTEIKLVDVPAMGYTAEDKPRPRGELCIRSDACFRYYYKDEANTKAAIDEEGWQHTGDVGEIDETS